MENGDA